MRLNRAFLPVLGALFMLSGFSALLLQTIFNKFFGRMFGVSAYATATVLAAFMLGLALGSFAVGKLLNVRLRRVLAVYGVLEFAIGLYAVCFIGVATFVEHQYTTLARLSSWSLAMLTAARFVGTIVLVVLPTTVMGASLPLLVEAARRREFPRAVNTLYALNVAGAALGAVAGAYVLFPRLHLDGALRIVFGCNLIVCAGAVLGEFLLRENATTTEDRSPARPPSIQSLGTPAVIAFASGFLVFATEVVWYHLLGLVVGTSTYAYAIMLTTTLLGLTGGAFLVRALTARGVSVARILIVAQVGFAAALMLTLPLWDMIPRIFGQLGFVVTSFAARETVRFVACCVLTLPAALAAGLTFPAVLRGVEAGASSGARVGLLNAVNTAGAICGSLAAGFVILEAIGGRGAVLLIALLSVLLLGLLVAGSWARRVALVGLGVAVWLASAVAMPSWDIKSLLSGANIYFGQAHEDFDSLVWQREDAVGGVTSVIRSGRTLTLLTNGKFQGNNGSELRDQQRLALIPNLFVRTPRRALNLGLGTGATLAVIAKCPYQVVDAVELAPDVVTAAERFFADVNGRVLEEPKVHLSVEDGRSFLALHSRDAPYDFVSIEVSSIWFAGAGNLYNDEFYGLVEANLAPQGVLQQWIQLHHVTAQDIAVIIATVREHFKYVELWIPSHQGIIVASNQPLEVIPERLFEVERSFPAGIFDLGDPRTLLGERLLDATAVDRFLSDWRSRTSVPISTDNNLYLEYSTPRGNVLGWNYDEILGVLSKYVTPDAGTAQMLKPFDDPRMEFFVRAGQTGLLERETDAWHRQLQRALDALPAALRPWGKERILSWALESRPARDVRARSD